MRPVDIGICHEDDTVIAQPGRSIESSMPQPRTVIMLRISSLDKILVMEAFSTLSILPLRVESPGSGGCALLWLNCRRIDLPPGIARREPDLFRSSHQFTGKRP